MLPPAPARPIRALLLDVGGPLEDETAAEAAWDRAVCRAFAAEGRPVAHRLAHANRQAIRSFAPNLYRSVIHHLANGDAALAIRVEARLVADLPPRPPLVLRPGWEGVLRACRSALLPASGAGADFQHFGHVVFEHIFDAHFQSGG